MNASTPSWVQKLIVCVSSPTMRLGSTLDVNDAPTGFMDAV